MSATIRVRRLEGRELEASLDDLAAILLDCLEGGASIGYVLPLSHAEARAAFASWAAEAEAGRRVVFGAFDGPELVGTAQLVFAQLPNQLHRADVSKLLVHRTARRRGIGQLLMDAVDDAALEAGRWLLVLDTATGDAERLYERLGWARVGVVPEFALDAHGTLVATTFYFKRLR